MLLNQIYHNNFIYKSYINYILNWLSKYIRKRLQRLKLGPLSEGNLAFLKKEYHRMPIMILSGDFNMNFQYSGG